MKATAALSLSLLLSCMGSRYADGPFGIIDASPDRPVTDAGVADADAFNRDAALEGGGSGSVGGGGQGGGGQSGQGGQGGGHGGVAGQLQPVGGLGGTAGAQNATGGGMTGGTTVTLTHQGGHCTTDTDCQAGLFCTDSVCCASRSCGGSACSSCSAPGATAGVCAMVPAGTQTPSCNGENACDAAGKCGRQLGKACSSSAECSSGQCTDGVCCSLATCGAQGCQACGAGGLCHPIADGTTTAMCDGASVCLGGACLTAKGHLCNSNPECATGHCVDGVCCDTACDGTCFACNQAGAVGSCTALLFAPDPRATATCGGGYVCAADGSSRCLLDDNAACSSSDQCASGTCAQVYYDFDGDGFGSTVYYKGATPWQLCKSSGTAAPTGTSFVAGDCCDSDANAHPGVTWGSADFNKCRSFDYDCDGVLTADHTQECLYTGTIRRCGEECAHEVSTGPTGTGTKHEVLWTNQCR